MNAELIKALKEDAEWAHGNEWETPITLGDHLDAAAAALEAAEKRIAELEAAQMWIPCSERLPEEYEEEGEVLTLDVHGFVEGFTASHIPAWNEHHPSHKITHWQPLPQLPQKGE